MGYASKITDTCSCGAVFSADGDHADLVHSNWLLTHLICRTTPTKQPTKPQSKNKGEK